MNNITEEDKEVVNQNIGFASVCWTETPKGTLFDMEQASKAADTILEHFNKRLEKAKEEK